RFQRGGYGRLVAVNVQPPLPASRFVSRAMIRDYHARQSEQALAPARRLAETLGVPLECRTLIDEPAAAIVRCARAARGDEIVMGTRGLGRWRGLILGSTATKVVQFATVPVTLVK
ncbi:MAG: universal stress protein, partial [Steroidobacteraceae bacterium]|nr:universal stress protein [Steroidobacteraceae bacterium]MDW8259109.1 universal stress protein [Gammaproteobacteria bacterium]